MFLTELFPVLTPLAIDPAHPFPFIPNLGFSLALKLKRRVRRPPALRPGAGARPRCARFWELPADGRRPQGPQRRYHRAGEPADACSSTTCSPAARCEAQGVFRLIRDSDIEIEEEAEDLVREFEALLKQRRLGSVVRVKIEAAMPDDLRAFIVDATCNAEPQDVDPDRRHAGPGPADRS